jgi:beta-carotene ketolase (CrtW type)
MQTFGSPLKLLKSDDWLGLLLVIVILSLWFVSLVALLTISVSTTSWFYLIGAVFLRTYLHTGLFILAHDSMHGNLTPHDRNLNNLIGRVAVTVYAFLSYDHCCRNHGNHHRYPSQSRDPDFHGNLANPIFWYCKFICEYFPWRSLIAFMTNMSAIVWGLILIFHVSPINLILFWLVPLVLSSLQLFFFGTYLPHRQVHENPHFSPRLQSNNYSLLWSLFSCYNFGHYHWEHHEYPKTPWYRLHSIHQ